MSTRCRDPSHDTMKIVAFAVLLFLLPAAVWGQQSTKRTLYCGVALGNGLEPWLYRQPNTNTVLRQARSDGANYAQVSAYLRQFGTTSTRTQQMTDDASLRVIIRKARGTGFKVFLKPVIQPENSGGVYVWRGYIPGTQAWFDKVHTPWILRMARIAQEEKVDVMSVGSEYVATQSNTAAWVATIAKVRSVYKGQLTYIANHDSYTGVKFYGDLDFISISAYFRLRQTRSGPYPDLPGTKRLYERELRKIVEWRSRNKLMNKKVLFAEYGIQSQGDGVAYYEPWEWTAGAKLSFEDQVKMYEAFFATFMPKPWNLGVMLWNYELNPNAGKNGPTLTGYTPQNKPALRVLRKYYQQYCQEEKSLTRQMLT